MTTKSWSKDTFSRKSLNDGSSDFWTAGGSGTNEYYYNQTDVLAEPLAVWANDAGLVRGTVGSLNGGEWDYADNDSIGDKRIYVRLDDGSDPDTKAAGYMECTDLFSVVDEGGGVTPVIVSFILSNLDTNYTASLQLYKTNSSDVVEWRGGIYIPGENTPVDWVTKFFLNDGDKIKVQSNIVETSIIISGDV